MAKRRAVSGALSNASTQLRQIALAMMRQQMEDESARKQAELVASRQRDLENLRHEHDLTERAAGEDIGMRTERRKLPFEIGRSTEQTLPSPSAVLAANQQMEGEPDEAFRGPFPVMNIPGLGPREQVAFPVGREGQSEIEQLLRAQAAKQQGFDTKNRIAEGYKERILPGAGVKGFQGAAGEEIPTELTGEQAGLKERDTALAGRLSPEVVSAEVDRAGDISYGQEAGQIKARRDLLGALEQIEKTISAARASGRPATQGIQSMQANGEKMIELANLLNNQAGGAQARVSGMVGRAMAFAGYNDSRKLLDDLREGTAIMFASALGHVGVKTQQDVDSTKRLLPEGGLTITESNNRNEMFRRLTKIVDRLGATMPPLGTPGQELTPDEQAEFIRRLNMAIQEASQQGGLPQNSEEFDAMDLIRKYYRR